MVRENLAEYAHNAWSGWMKYLFEKSTFNLDGSVTIPPWAVKRWERQMETVYAGLPESEKESDREEADSMLLIMRERMKEKIRKEETECSKLINALNNTEPRVLNNDEAVNKITVMDDPGAGGACHRYLIEKDGISLCFVKFQEGPIKEFGVNGCQNEDLLAIVIDRLECFQAGEYACVENFIALEAVKKALLWLNKRTKDRAKRGVEGTNKV